MRMNDTENDGFDFYTGFEGFFEAEWVHHIASQPLTTTLAQCCSVSLAGAVFGFIGYMVLCVPSPEEVERKRRKKEIMDYNQGYVAELEDLDERDLTEGELVGLSERVVEDETPFGRVIMTYSSDSESYWYYADSKSVPYMTLDALSRQFAVKYDCKTVCVNYKEEWEKSKAAALAQKTEDEKKPDETVVEKGERDVFAKFQSYNTNNKRTDSIKRRRYRIMTDKSNQFSHKGALADYKKVPTSKQPDVNKKKLSFSEFKAKQC